MPAPAKKRCCTCFGDFEVDLRRGELRHHGTKIRLQEKPFQILVVLLQQPGELVTRDELREKLWPGDTFVDFEHGINTAVRKLREALRDDPENPRFIETSPRHGYSFIAPVKHHLPKSTPATTVAAVSSPPPAAMGTSPLQTRAMGTSPLQTRAMGTSPLQIRSIAVLPFENLSSDPELEFFADALTEELITNLGKTSPVRVISRTSVLRYKGTLKPLPEIAQELNADTLVEGTVRRCRDRVRITANLLHAPSDRHLWAEAYERELKDTLAVQSDVMCAIAAEIRSKLLPWIETRPDEGPLVQSVPKS